MTPAINNIEDADLRLVGQTFVAHLAGEPLPGVATPEFERLAGSVVRSTSAEPGAQHLVFGLAVLSAFAQHLQNHVRTAQSVLGHNLPPDKRG